MQDFGGVSLAEAYRQNDSPVYQIEITNDKGKNIKFGSSLKHDEKRWLLGQLESVLDPVTDVEILGEVARLDEYQSKGLEIKRVGDQDFRVTKNYLCGKWLILGGLFMMLVAGFIFVQTWSSSLHSSDGSGPLWFLFHLFDYVGLLATLVAAIVAAGVMAGGFWATGRVVVSEFNSDGVTVTTKWRQSRHKKRFSKEAFHKVKRSSSGHVNNEPRYRVTLVGNKKNLTVCGFANDEASS